MMVIPMNISITQKKENILLNRTEVKGELAFEGATPSNATFLDALAHECKCEQNMLSIEHIHTQFGKQQAKFMAYIYVDAAAKKKATRITSHLRKKIDEEKKKAAEKKEGAQ